jgi:UDP-N-acetyl-D-galactosamine dehydrogenase
VPDIVAELREFGIEPMIADPHADPREAHEEYELELSPVDALTDLNGLILAVGHREFLERDDLGTLLVPGGVLIDVKSALDPLKLPAGLEYWSL